MDRKELIKRIKKENILMLDDVKIKKQIEQNRNEINNWLNGDYPLYIVYTRINMLSQQNKRLIEKLKSI